MSNFVSIQSKIFCENCKDCGARPVVEQVKDGYVVRCPNDKKHYKTNIGTFEPCLKDWNLKNRTHVPVVGIPAQIAS